MHHNSTKSKLKLVYCILLCIITYSAKRPGLAFSSRYAPTTCSSVVLRVSPIETNCSQMVGKRRRELMHFLSWAFIVSPTPSVKASGPMIDVNNAVAREYTAFPGLYPTIASKLINAAKEKPFTSKAQVYAALDNDVQRERLRQYDAAILISSPDMSVRQFKESQICKYECKGRVSARQ